jgi:hypothetical protein
LLASSHSDAVGSVQLSFSRHSTHAFVSASHTGVAPSHASASVAVHSTHVRDVVSQTGASSSQCVLLVHSTHVSVGA